jgi:hypothetical protein
MTEREVAMLRAIPISEQQFRLFVDLQHAEGDEQKRIVASRHGCRFSHASGGVDYVFPEYLYLDDERTPIKHWYIVRDADEMIDLLREYKNSIHSISLDHDLGTERTGYDVLLWIEREIVENNYKPPIIELHTGNMSAMEKMRLATKKIREMVQNAS